MNAGTLILLSGAFFPADVPAEPGVEPPGNPAFKDDLSDLQGSWTIVGLCRDGNEEDPKDWAGRRWVFEGNGVFFEKQEASGQTRYGMGTVTVDRCRNPIAIDRTRLCAVRICGNSLPSPGSAAKRLPESIQVVGLGRFRRTDDLLIWAEVDDASGGSARPRTLTSEPGSGVVLWTLKRDKK